MSTVRAELVRPAGRVTELPSPAPGTAAGSGEGVAVSSLAGTVQGAVRPVLTSRTGLQAVVTCEAGAAATAPRHRVTPLRDVTGGADLPAVQSEGSRGAGVLALWSRVAGLAPTLTSGGMTGGAPLPTLAVQAAVLAPPSLLTDRVAPLSPPPVATLAAARDVVAALAVLLLAVAAVLAVQAVAPRPAAQLTVDPPEAGQTDTFSPLVAAPIVLTGTFLLAVLSEPSFRTRGVAVGSRPTIRTRTLKHHGVCQPQI